MTHLDFNSRGLHEGQKLITNDMKIVTSLSVNQSIIAVTTLNAMYFLQVANLNYIYQDGKICIDVRYQLGFQSQISQTQIV